VTADPAARMVAHQLEGRDIIDRRVLDAMRAVPRDAFVDDAQRALAYDDMPLPIGHGQTISQPYIVAMTAQALELEGDERVLDVGTGSGYASAVLGRLARDVYTIERIPELARVAADRLARLAIRNVHVVVGDGTLGWPTAAPYDAIAVAAAAPRAPRPLLEQLAIGGRLVLPVGDDARQRMLKYVRRDAVTYVESDLGAVMFVPLVGAEGW
jgi:protein-L-isoaspartate(D-aspartate) O-methyltransferase